MPGMGMYPPARPPEPESAYADRGDSRRRDPTDEMLRQIYDALVETKCLVNGSHLIVHNIQHKVGKLMNREELGKALDQVADNNAEAFGEISGRITDLADQIEKLKAEIQAAGNLPPDLAAKVDAAVASSRQLADIVQEAAPTEPTEPTDPEQPTEPNQPEQPQEPEQPVDPNQPQTPAQ